MAGLDELRAVALTFPGAFEDWIEESYRATVPKKLVAELDTRRNR